MFAEQIEQLREEPGGEILTQTNLAVILKAMLVHGASWNDWEPFIDRIFDGPDGGPSRWRRIKHACAQFLGYGVADFEKGTICTDERVILIGASELRDERAHVYRVPLPTALHAQTIQRRLTITLAWITPTNPKNRNYRVADLWFDPPKESLRLKRADGDHDAVCRGTVQREVLVGNASVPIAEDDSIHIQVNCRSVAGSLTSRVPYCLMVSLETGAPLAVSVYEQVRLALERIRSAARVRPTIRGRSQS